ncbi:uncharacterized protein LOC128674074 [Plodia interpunctella]|uniref:uncharacterized protein LOC128674074 n=1 Tax=Plodia interpunctella TaxID=58824 RepID=UPI00236822BE|nr:uncharacterized protein LOC128674074 [Plodia interpunctella]XP_053608365.1 uncharacterized protein LOC128674074 [Plodia interpunctella]XP_053608373.1 uncharacterized protein LOC128674074 [Plodia interpunctella]
MVNYYIYAKDFSGSTDGESYFHENGIKTLQDFKKDVEKIKKEQSTDGEPIAESKIIYLHWGDKCYEVDEDITILSYKELSSGHMGTYPETIIEWIQRGNYICRENNKIKLLYIITDGMIDYASSHKCLRLNINMHYENVVFHAINKNEEEIDLSVAASFFKSHCTIYRNYILYDNINISEEFDYDKINVDNFFVERDNLKSYIKLKYISKVKKDAIALQEIDKLKKLRNRLFADLSSRTEKGEINLNTKDKETFLRDFVRTDWYLNLNAASHDVKVDIEKSISTLINYIISDTKSFSFDALKFDMKFDKPIEEEPIVDVNFTTEQEIEFPDIIMYDDKGIPVIVLTELNLLDKIIFHRTDTSSEVSPASFNKFKSTMDCPLFLANDPDICESIGYFYTLNVYKQLLDSNIKTEPRTRRQFHGGLVLIDTDEFDKYNDYILSATYFNHKKIHYNIGLFYYVLWKNCENKEWMDKNVIEKFKNYTMRRIEATVCKIGLSSLPLDPQVKTSLPTALWYCVELSSSIFKDDPLNFMHERLRMYYGMAHCMIEILKILNYDLDLESIGKRRDIIRHVMILKKIPNQSEKVYYLLDKIFKSTNGFLISEIEHPCNLNKLNFLKLNHKDMLRDDDIEQKLHLNDYVHLMNFNDYSKAKNGISMFDICEKTFRPYFTIGQNRSFYTELFEISKKIVINNDDDKNKINITYDDLDSLEFNKILSVYNLFIRCVQDLEKYPTLPEYTEYIHKKKKYIEDKVTIFPPNVYIAAESVYSRYQNIMTKVDVKTFIHVTKSYVNRSERIKAEEVVRFSDDNEVTKFILSEELKVKLQIKAKSGASGSPQRSRRPRRHRHGRQGQLIKASHMVESESK